MTSIDVLIAGSGPTGLAAALTLAQNGIAVRVIEKLPEFPKGQRGAGIMPRTLELYHFLGVLGDVKSQARNAPLVRQYSPQGEPLKTFTMMDHVEPTPAVPEANALMLGQDAACAILRTHLKAFGVEVELGSELTALEQHKGGVTVHFTKTWDGIPSQEKVNAKYVVGADGAKGAVRKLLDLTFVGESRDETHAVIGDAQVFGLEDKYWYRFGDNKTTMVMVRPTNRSDENIFFIMARGRDLDTARAVEDHEYLRKFIAETANQPDMKVGNFDSISDWRPNIRMANKFQEGRVFVAGDAAHVHSPTGGQGMNSSVMDAVNLSWKLALVLKGISAPSLLDTYTEERLPVISEMLQLTTELLNKNMDATRVDPESAWRRGASLTQLDVHYRWSSIVLNQRGAHETDARQAVASTYTTGEPGGLRAGDRAPDAPGLADVQTAASRRLFDIFRPTRHTVLLFSAEGDKTTTLTAALTHYPKDLIQVVTVYPQQAASPTDIDGAIAVVQDKNGHAYAAYGVTSDASSTTIAIVRPDGVVGAIISGVNGVQDYFTKVFSAA